MLTKILFTLAVIVVVALFFRHKTDPKATKRQEAAANAPQKGVQSRTIIYALLGLTVAVSSLLYWLHWQNQHQIININVTHGGGETISYQAYKKSIEGRRFTTLDDRKVTLGESDRVEMAPAE
jgi:uncharacterized protein YpmB